MSGLASAGPCIVVKIRHPRGLPRGAARCAPGAARKRELPVPRAPAGGADAPRQHPGLLGKVRSYRVLCEYGGLALGSELPAGYPGAAGIDDDIYEDLQLESDEEWRAPTTDLWLARAWGWVDTDTTLRRAPARRVGAPLHVPVHPAVHRRRHPAQGACRLTHHPAGRHAQRAAHAPRTARGVDAAAPPRRPRVPNRVHMLPHAWLHRRRLEPC